MASQFLENFCTPNQT